MKHEKRLRNIWKGMKQRCLNPNSSNYKMYGGRGITIYDEWKSSFIKFYFDSIEAYCNYIEDIGELPTIDRIDNDGDYEPDNCRWTDQTEQYYNSRNIGDLNRTPNTPRYTFRDIDMYRLELAIRRKFDLHSEFREDG